MGQFKNIKEVRYRGITFKSKLELTCYQAMLSKKIECSYESESFLLQEGFSFMGKKYRPITYTPDFIARDAKGAKAIIECKGYVYRDFPLRKKMLLKKLSGEEEGCRYFLVQNEKDVLSLIDALL